MVTNSHTVMEVFFAQEAQTEYRSSNYCDICTCAYAKLPSMITQDTNQSVVFLLQDMRQNWKSQMIQGHYDALNRTLVQL